MTHLPILAINFHLWEPCNKRCKFCFATFKDVKQTVLPKGHLPKESCLALINLIAAPGIKITFAGGEPTLCPWLAVGVKLAKAKGATTMVVTNGSKITPAYLRQFEGCLDWIALSVDSLDDSINLASGRAIAGRRVLTQSDYLSVVAYIKTAGIRFKLNTTVHALNWQENLSTFIEATQPERWKVFQVLRVDGQNDAHFSEFAVTSEQFQAFCQRHAQVATHLPMVPESNELMRGSYLMIDPAGRFYDSTQGKHTYSDPILSVGVEKALDQVRLDQSTFLARGGRWDW